MWHIKGSVINEHITERWVFTVYLLYSEAEANIRDYCWVKGGREGVSMVNELAEITHCQESDPPLWMLHLEHLTLTKILE